MSGRTAFLLVAALVLGLALLTAVILPALARGGAAELLLVAAAFLAILLVERWLRYR